MAANWCLPRDLADRFVKAILDGSLDMEKIARMSSADRSTEFAKIVGDENARMVNEQFESKLLLKNQKAGLLRWAQKLSNVSEPARRDIVASINKLDRVLNPTEEQAFLSDLAAKKLGVTVTADEAKEIFALAQKAQQLRDAITAKTGNYRDGWTPESGTAYGMARQAMIDRINELKPHGAALKDRLTQALSLTREAETSVMHWSAPFVQLVGMISTKEWWQGLGKQFQFFASEENYDKLVGYITGHPNYELALDGKLGLTRLGDKLTKSEEGLQSHLLLDASEWLNEKTGVTNLIRGAPPWARALAAGDGNLIAGWQRSFVGVCNYVRFERFNNIIDGARAQGLDVSPGSDVVRNAARVVNNFTGRGDEISGPTGTIAINPGVLSNAVFYSPRKLAATMEMFNPVAYAKLDPYTRGVAMRQLAGFLVATGSVMMLAKFAGAQVNFDPRSANFGKIGVAGEQFDMTGGNASYLRLLSRLATLRTIDKNGVESPLNATGAHGSNAKDMFTNFLLGRLAPNAALIADAIFGPYGGGAFDLGQEVRQRLTPMVIDSYIRDIGNNPDWQTSIVPALTALLGVGMESPEPPISESGRDVFGNQIPGTDRFMQTSPVSWENDPVVKEARAVNLYLDFPSKKITGVPLTDQQYDDYSRLSGRLAHARLEDVISMPGWQNVPAAVKKTTMQHAIEKARGSAANAIKTQSMGTANDIPAKAYAAKQAANARTYEAPQSTEGIPVQ